MAEMNDNNKDNYRWFFLLRLLVEVVGANTTTNHQRVHCRQVDSGL
jgi:hypothetical protein